MTTAVMAAPITVNRMEEDRWLNGADLTELLAKAAVERDVARAAGVRDDLEIEAVYSVDSGDWTVQVFNRTTGRGGSLYRAG